MATALSSTLPLLNKSRPLEDFRIDDGAWSMTGREIDHSLKRRSTIVPKKLVGPSDTVRRKKDIFKSRKAGRGIQWLAHEAIECRASNSILGKCIEQSVFIDDATACGVDQIRCRLHECEFANADQILRLLIEWAVNRCEI